MKELFPHSATTNDITVRVSVSFLPEQSEPGQGRWFWAYHVRIENGGAQAVQGLVTGFNQAPPGKVLLDLDTGESLALENVLEVESLDDAALAA